MTTWNGDLSINTDSAAKFMDIKFKDTITLSGIELKYSHKGEIVTAHRTIPNGDIIKAAILSAGPTGKIDLKFKDGFVAVGVNRSDIV